MRKLGLLIRTLAVVIFLGLAIMTSSANALTPHPLPQITLSPLPSYIGIDVNNRLSYTDLNLNLNINSDNSTPINWTASGNASWLSLSKTNGTTPDTLTFNIDSNSFAVGTMYTATITVTATNPANTPVTRQVNAKLVETNYLYQYGSLKKGGYLRSANGQYKFILQMDSNLVLYNSNNEPLWASHTDGQDVREFKINGGALDLINTSGQVIWRCRMDDYEHQGQILTVKDEGFLESRNYYGGLTWSSNKLLQGYMLMSGYELSARGGLYRLKMQEDGNLVLRIGTGLLTGQVVWSSHTYGGSGSYCIMQDDGNLVIYNSNNQLLWATGTSVNSYGYNYMDVLVRNDGNVVICNRYNNNIVYWDRFHGKY